MLISDRLWSVLSVTKTLILKVLCDAKFSYLMLTQKTILRESQQFSLFQPSSWPLHGDASTLMLHTAADQSVKSFKKFTHQQDVSALWITLFWMYIVSFQAAKVSVKEEAYISKDKNSKRISFCKENKWIGKERKVSSLF